MLSFFIFVSLPRKPNAIFFKNFFIETTSNLLSKLFFSRWWIYLSIKKDLKKLFLFIFLRNSFSVSHLSYFADDFIEGKKKYQNYKHQMHYTKCTWLLNLLFFQDWLLLVLLKTFGKTRREIDILFSIARTKNKVHRSNFFLFIYSCHFFLFFHTVDIKWPLYDSHYHPITFSQLFLFGFIFRK